jgi:hypothetical protein
LEIEEQRELRHLKNSGYTILDNRSIVVQLDSKLSESWNNNFIGGYDKQIEDRGLQGGGLFYN